LTSDEAIDELYQAPLNEFTAKRNALVKTLRGADATNVRKLEKPSIVAWAVNQVYWNARPLYDRVIKSGERLRRAQIAALEGKGADVRGATEAHRHAVAEAVTQAERFATASGSRPGRDAVMRTFEAISLAAEPPNQPGRLTEALQPAGFEALTGITPTRAAVPTDHDRREPERAPSTRERGPASGDRDETGGKKTSARLAREKKIERARRDQEAAEARRQAAEDKRHQAEIRKLEAAIEHAKATEARARAEWERARDALREAEERLKSVR
jgi:hypothetical protein